MERENTKQAIVREALRLFSVQGFEATSVSQIADAVGIRKASLYCHFENKQAILDAVVALTQEYYSAHSIFTTDWEDPAVLQKMQGLTLQQVTKAVQAHVRYILHDEKIGMVRKMLKIEQFRNGMLAGIQTRQTYTEVLRYAEGLIGFLVRQGRVKTDDVTSTAAQFCFPVSVWIDLCDREPEREEEVMGRIEKHITQFFRVYGNA